MDFLVLETPAGTGNTTAGWKSHAAPGIGTADVLYAKKAEVWEAMPLKPQDSKLLSRSLPSLSFGPSLSLVITIVAEY